MSELKTNLQSILQEKTTKIIPQNIKKDVEVLDVIGSYDKEDIKELQDELADAEQELADVRRDLDNSTATVSGSGENITLSGTAEARFKKAPLPLGNTEQEVIEAQAGTTVEGESILANGVDLSKVEILNINGNTKQETATGKNLYDDNFDDYNQPYDYYIYPINLEQGETYTLSATLVGSNVNGVAVAIVPFGEKYSDFSDNMQMCLHTDGTTNVKTFTVNDTWTSPKLVLYLGYSKVKSVFDSVFENYEIQLEKSSTKTDYEPYTGGKASPNPDYPQEAYSAGANMNLFDKNNVISNAYLDSNGNEAFDGVWNITDYIPIISNKVYSYNGITTPGVAPYSAYYDSNKNFISSFKQAIGKNSIIVPSNAAYVRFSLAARNTDPIFNDLDTFKFEKGNETTAYSAYNQGNMNVEISNKNLWNGELEQNAWNNSDGTTTVWSNQYIRSKSFIEVKSNTIYTLNYSMLNNEVKNGNILLYDKDKNFINSLQTPNNLTFTTSSATKYLKFNFYAGAGASIEGMSNLQLEQGSTATTYVAHEGQSFTIPTQAPFRKIGDYKDTFVKKVDGKWYEKHIIGNIVFDGSEDENWRQDNNDTYITISDAKGTGAIPVVSNYFTYTGNASGNSWGQIRFGMSNNNLIFFGNLILSDFKMWLSTHNTIVDYVLAEPTYIECTQEQSDILDQINTFYETTNIFSIDEVSPNFTFTYNKVYTSPSPDDESPVQTVSGDVDVKVQNKNLFNKDNIKTINYYIQPIAPNPGEHIYSLNNRNCEIEVEPNTDYIRNIVKVNNMTFWSSITFYDKDHVFISGLWSPDNIITTPSNAKYMILSTSGNVSSLFGDELVLETYYNSLQLEKGTTLTNYVEHREQVLPLTLKSKNLFDGEIELGSINPGNGELQPSTARTRSKNFLKVEPNTTYTMSVQTGQYRWIIGYTADKIGIIDGNTSGQASAISTFPVSTEKTNTFTTTATTEYIKWYDTSSTDLTEKVQIEEGTTATSYEPYYNYKLCKIGDYQDYFYKESNKWYLHKKIGKVLFDGDENFNELGQNDNGLYMYAFYKDDMVNAYNKKVLLCNYFTSANNYIELNSTSSELVGIFSTSRISFCTKLSSSNDWKSWLSTHNTSVYYPLVEAISTEITDTILINQLEAIRKAISYDEQTNVSSNTIALFDIIALRNMNTTLNTLENEIELLP